MGKIFAVGVGPGSPKYVTEIVKDIVQKCDIVIGYKYTLKTIENLIENKEVYEIIKRLRVFRKNFALFLKIFL